MRLDSQNFEGISKSIKKCCREATLQCIDLGTVFQSLGGGVGGIEVIIKL